MPVFRIDILFANRKRHKEHHIVDGVELDDYYRHVFRIARMASIPIASFDVVQISEFSVVATFMRNNNIKRMMPNAPTVRPTQGTYRRRRRM
jgi:hypothetical protein